MTNWLTDLQQAEKLMDLAMLATGKLLAALAVFFIGKWLVSALIKLVRAAMRRGRVDDTLGDFLGNVLFGVAIVVVVVAALGTLGVDTTSAAAVLGGGALAIGLSLQNQLSSLAAGVIIILFRPFKKGDFVEISGVQGTVEEIKIISTHLRTVDNKALIVPNSSITTHIITNYTAKLVRRLDLTVSIGYDADLRRAKDLLMQILAEDERVLRAPAASVQVRALGDTAVALAVWPWVKTEFAGDLESDLRERIKLRFDEAGIELAYRKNTVLVGEP